MAKIPEIGGVLDKFKSLLENITGPSGAGLTSEALEKETDPVKVKYMELKLLINQLNDIQILSTRTIHALQSKYTELEKILELQKQAKQKAEAEKAASEAETAGKAAEDAETEVKTKLETKTPPPTQPSEPKKPEEK